MAKKATKNTASTVPAPRSALAAISEGALLAVILSALAMQPNRFEPFEAEKAALLAIITAVILGAAIARLLVMRQSVRVMAAGERPLWIVVGGTALMAVISTAFALSPAQSLFGTAFRSQGLITTLCCLVLFIAAANASRDFLATIPIATTLITFMLCVHGIVQGIEGNFRNRDVAISTAGQANYLSTWLVIGLLVGLPYFFSLYQSWKRPLKAIHKATLFLPFALTVLVVSTFMITQSRGALLSLLAGGLAMIILVAIRRGATRFLRILLGFSVVAAVGYVGLVLVLRGSDGDVPRFLSPYDQVRVQMWNAATEVIVPGRTPLTSPTGAVDPYAFLRPLIGYGLENIDQTNQIFRDYSIVDRFHNVVFDTITAHGWIGFLAWGGVFLVGVSLALGMLGFPRAWRRVLIGAGVGSIFGVPLGLLLATGASVGASVPAGASLGAALGVIGAFAIKPPQAPADLKWNIQQAFALSVFGVLIAQWIDLQFSFTYIAALPTFWILLGGLLAYRRQSSLPVMPALSNGAGNLGISPLILAAGLIFTHSMATTLQSQIFSGPWSAAELFVPLLALVVLSFPLLALTNKYPLEPLAGIFALWLVFLGFKAFLSATGGAWLDLGAAGDYDLVMRSIHLLSTSGVVAILIAIAACAGRDGLKISIRMAVPIAAALVISCGIYSWNYAGDTLHRLAAAAAPGKSTPEAMQLAQEAFRRSEQYQPYNLRLHMNRITFILNWAASLQGAAKAILLSQVDELLAQPLIFAPFASNSRDWAQITEFYEKIR